MLPTWLTACLLASVAAPSPSASASPAPSAAASPARATWPLPAPHQVVHGFDPPAHRWDRGHRGVDLLGRDGEQVRSATSGTVRFSGVIAGVGVVSVVLDDGRRLTYQPLTHRIARGAAVTAGETIGALGRDGSHCAPAACLHWGLLVAADQYRDPLTLLRRRRPVLLPLVSADAAHRTGRAPDLGPGPPDCSGPSCPAR